MSDQSTLSVSSKPIPNLLDTLGFSNKKYVPIEIVKKLDSIRKIASRFGKDEEFLSSLLKSYESKTQLIDDSYIRADRFLKFIETLSNSDDFERSVKSMNLLPKSELEQYAIETGDWSHFLKRIENDNKENELGPKAKV